MAAKYAACCLAMAAGAHAIVGPNLPWGGTTDVAGQDCKIGWALDTTGAWTNMSIELMTGDNQAFVHLSWVAHGLDGTSGDGSYTWKCPTVDPPAKIYFYQFSNPGQAATYTTRFTLANADGSTVDPPQQTQPDGSAIPWGTGRILSGGDGTADTGSTNSSTPSGSGAGSSSLTGSTGSSSSAGSSGSSASTPSSSTSADDTTDAGTTVVTVQPSTTANRASSSTSTRMSTSPVSSGIAGNSNNNTGAAMRNLNQGSMMAGLGLIFAIGAGWIIA